MFIDFKERGRDGERDRQTDRQTHETHSLLVYEMMLQPTGPPNKGMVPILLFLNYILCYYSCPNFPPVAPPILLPTSSGDPHTVVHVHGSCAYIYILFPVLYFTSPWLFCNLQFVLLNPFTFFCPTCNPLPLDNHQIILCIYDSVSVLLVF